MNNQRQDGMAKWKDIQTKQNQIVKFFPHLYLSSKAYLTVPEIIGLRNYYVPSFLDRFVGLSAMWLQGSWQTGSRNCWTFADDHLHIPYLPQTTIGCILIDMFILCHVIWYQECWHYLILSSSFLTLHG